MTGTLFILLTGCATKPDSARPRDKAVVSQDESLGVRNQAYSLFYQLMADEGNVSKLLIIKKEQPDVGALIKDISLVCGDAAKQIERFAKADPHLHIKMTGLPAAEVETRDLIAKTRTKELIGKTGEKFELRVLLTQSEALTYGAHLAAVAQTHETDAARKQFLGGVSERLQDLHQRMINLMHARWQMPATKN